MTDEKYLTYILVDFENIQPTDMGLLSGEQYQLRIFRGPHQNKLDFDIVESLQPFGDRVKHIQSDQHGRNALDLHIAFYMGRLVEEVEKSHPQSSRNTRFVVISKDGGFDALMSHAQSLGYRAEKATTIREAMRIGETGTKPGCVMDELKTDAAAQTAKAKHSHELLPKATSAHVNTASPPKNGLSVTKTAANPPKAAEAPTASASRSASVASSAPKALAQARKRLTPEDREKVLDHLRQHARARPVKQITLERHLTSLLGGKVAPAAVQGLIAGFKQDGIIRFEGKRIVAYKIPKRTLGHE
jgi:hypothetical protein